MGHVICIYPYVPIFLFRDSPDFALSTENLRWDELNELRQKLFVKTKKTIQVYR